jgi:hypothetical protein
VGARWAAVIAAISLLIAVLTALANVALWFDRQMLDSEAFSEGVTEAMRTAETRDAIADVAVGKAIDAIPLIGFFEDPLRDLVVVVLDSPALEGTNGAVADSIHRVLVTGEQSAITLSLIAVKDALLGPIGEAAPTLVDQIPNDFFDAVEIIEAGALPSLEFWADVGPWLGAFAAALAVFLAAVLLTLSPYRAWSLVGIGMACFLAVLMSFAAIPIGRSMAEGMVSGELATVITTASYYVFARSLVTQTRILVILGVVLTAAGVIWVGINYASSTREA